MSSVLSPIKFLKSTLFDVSLDISSSLCAGGKFDPKETRVGLGVNRDTTTSRKEDRLFCDCVMSIELTVIDGKEDEEKEPLVVFACTMRALVSSPEMAEDSELSEDILEANTISFIWSKMRNLFEILSVDTPIGKKLTLPALDPYALLKDEQDEEDEG